MQTGKAGWPTIWSVRIFLERDGVKAPADVASQAIQPLLA